MSGTIRPVFLPSLLVCLSALLVVPALAEPALVTAPPTPQQIIWLEDHAAPLATVEADGGFEDLAFLKDLVGNSRIVGLGECTHGSREVFQMKHRLLEYLATEMDFSIFSIEASTPEAYRLNEYVLGGDGDPAELIGGMYFWTWNTEEVLAMVQWMRAFNDSGKGPVQFTGFDMQFDGVARQNVLSFLEDVDPETAKTTFDLYAQLVNVQNTSTFGVATYSFPVEAARGKTITYTGSIRTEDVDEGFAGLWWRVDGPDRARLGFDNMHDRGVTGTTEWQRYSIEMPVPDEAENINFGVILPGQGKAWFDNLEVLLDGEPYIPGKSLDFDYEGDKLLGYTSNDESYQASLATDHVVSGNQSLLLECVNEKAAGAINADQAAYIAKLALNGLTARSSQWTDKASAQDIAWALHNARIVEQCQRMGTSKTFNVRDQAMAENVGWIVQQNPDAKVVLWAHNAHIARITGMMGSYLDQTFGDDYLPVGFATAEGTYYAVSRGSGDKVHDLTPPEPGSIEAFFIAAGMPLAMLDLRPARAMTADSGWLRENRPMRGIGAMAMEKQFRPGVTAGLFDALIFIEQTSAARQLATPPAAKN